MKKFFGFVITLLFFSLLFCQESLTKLNTTWAEVLPGKVVTEPTITTFGFSLITDAKSISTYSNSGKLLWEKSISSYRGTKIYALPEDFFLLIKNNLKTISLLNPSGCEIWSIELENSLLDTPVAGRDGRFFLKSKNAIECYGITGTRKWKLDLPEQNNLEIQELPDGSLVTFLQQTIENKTKGLRISPFGQILEEIIFSGNVLRVNSCDKGILLTFDDGASGLFALNNEQKAENKWVLQSKNLKPDSEQIKNARFIVDDTKENVFYLYPFSNKIQLFKINTENGTVEESFFIEKINGLNLQKVQYQFKNLFISDSNNGSFISENGQILWNGLINGSKKERFNYQIFTHDNTLVLCNLDWSLDAYRLKQNLKVSNFQNNQTKKYSKNYNSYLLPLSDAYLYLNSINKELASEKRIEILNAGDYGVEEIKFINQLQEACESYSSFLNSKTTNYTDGKSFFETDISDINLFLSQLSLFSDRQFNKYISKFLKQVTNRSLITTLLTGITKNGYDPDLEILDSLEILTGKINYKDDVMLCKICDTVYSICVFMGRPAYNSKGKEIVTKMLAANYSTKTRVYARNTLKKLSDLDL